MKNLKIYLVLFTVLFNAQLIFARPLSIASKAKVSSSSQLDKRHAHDNINDGIISIDGKGNWMAKGNDAWIMLSWDKPQLVDKIVIFNSPSETNRIL